MEAGMIQCMYCTYTPNLNFILYNVEYNFLKPTHAPNHQPTHTQRHIRIHIWIYDWQVLKSVIKKILSANSPRSLQPCSTLHSTDVSILRVTHVYNSSCFHQFALVFPPLCSLLPTVNHSLFRCLVFLTSKSHKNRSINEKLRKVYYLPTNNHKGQRSCDERSVYILLLDELTESKS